MSSLTVITELEITEPESTDVTVPQPTPCIQDVSVSVRNYAPVYDRFTKLQKNLMTGFVAYAGLIASISTTTVLAAVPEISSEFKTTPTIINISNAVYLSCVGLSCFFWGPWADNFGRKSAYIGSSTMFVAFSIGTALSPNLVSFFIFRALTACQVTALLIVGPTLISDIYHPVERGTSLSWFALGTMFGPAFGPLLGGVVVTYSPWRTIFWVQTALAALALLQAIYTLHETLQYPRYIELRGQKFRPALSILWKWSNPRTVFEIFTEKNLLCVASTPHTDSRSQYDWIRELTKAWNMFSLLTPIRFVLNPTLNLTSPLQSGLLFLAPGAGYILGTQVGGRWADRTAKSWTRRRGYRLQEDRLRSCILTLGILMPGTTLLYGWSLDRNLGGIPLPAISMALLGFAQTFASPALNVYILDVSQNDSGKASASHYFARYVLMAAATATCLPSIQAIGVGWTATISAGLVLIGAGLVLLVLRLGQRWRDGS
ncbi:unnamed protein product [Clonostachys byssicola]|uniref:Major facilitator superfamily (MFS) profile domain-containing protein n=1 Tax=Clonostachys byssicola TaxID=160290 RepID=A0A9N9U2U2_9HYPO|nr:unnamed protein product [Clonostachys byssicola]